MKKYNNIYIILFFFILCSFSATLQSAITNNNITNNQPLQNNATAEVQQPINNPFAWQEVKVNENIKSNNRFNWYRRKILSEKTFTIYNNIVIIITSISKSITLFKEKINEINDLKNDFDNNIKKKISEFNQEYTTLNNLLKHQDQLEAQLNSFKESYLYINNKDFRKKIDKENQNFINIKSMINNINENIVIFYRVYNTMVSSINNLDHIQEETKILENTAWNKYQQLDELINDQNANKNFLEVTNIFDNLSNYNFYIRNTFLKFFNESLFNLSNGSSNILNAIDEIIQKIKYITTQVNLFYTEIKKAEDYEKEKLLQEQEEKRLEAERLIAIENQKKLNLEKEKNKLSWYKNIFVKIQNYSQDILVIFSNYTIKFINILNSYYDLFFNKNNIIIKKHNQISNQNQSTVISQDIANLQPLSDNQVQVIPFTTQLNPQQEQQVTAPIISETMLTQQVEKTEDVFNKKTNPIIPKEKEQGGSASYPKRTIVPQIAQVPNEQPQTGELIIKASEEINVPENAENKKDQIQKENFTYKLTDQQNQENKELVNPLIDLSGIQKNNPMNYSDRGISSTAISAVEGGPETSKVNNNFRAKTIEKRTRRALTKKRKIKKKQKKTNK